MGLAAHKPFGLLMHAIAQVSTDLLNIKAQNVTQYMHYCVLVKYWSCAHIWLIR
jgi:hypothetical protein